MHAEYSKRREVEINWRIFIIKYTSIYLMQHLMCPHNALLFLSSPLLFYPFSSYCLLSFFFFSILPLPFPLHLFPHLIFHCTCNCYDITMIWYFFPIDLVFVSRAGTEVATQHRPSCTGEISYSSFVIFNHLQSSSVNCAVPHSVTYQSWKI